MDWIMQLEVIIRESAVYRDFLAKMPAPVNNVYFDMVLVILLAILLVYRIVDFIWMRIRHRKLRQRQEEVRRQNEADRLIREEEARVQQGKLAAFLKYIEMQMKPKGYRSNPGEQTKGIDGKCLRIGSTHSANDFEILMEEARKNDDD